MKGKNKKLNSMLLVIFLVIQISCTSNNEQVSIIDQMKVSYSGDAKIEVGSEFVGVEFHHSSALPQRVSFYYPVANSIDMSTDYWKRDTSYMMALGLKVGDNEKEWIDPKYFDFKLTPFSVEFEKSDEYKSIKISYRFSKTKPAAIIEYEITNLSGVENEYEVYTTMEGALKTCHSYNLKDKAWTEYDDATNSIVINYEDPETQKAQVFITNAGEEPSSYSSVSDAYITPNKKTDQWFNGKEQLDDDIIAKVNMQKPAAKFLYKKILKPNESIKVIHVLGSCRQEEGQEIRNYLKKNYQKEIDDFENSIAEKIVASSPITTNDDILDNGILWSKAVLEVCKHYIDGSVAPMPCPAEYNFYFTHDVLVTDLSAVYFDIQRVRNDLEYIVAHADEDNIIPHAYYWKDSLYLTEFASHDNWNNFWFTIVSAEYLKHSGDKEFLKSIYPYLQKSLERSLLTKGDDDLMWSFQPDWWDIGHIYGRRSYMTILMIKSLRSLTYISSTIGSNLDKCVEWEALADRMQKNLTDYLWSDSQKYLINDYEPGQVDTHYYIGSLLASHYSLLDKNKNKELVESAEKYLVDPKVGVYNAFPMDFHELAGYLKFVGNEAGEPYYYANGGIWPQGNAWYALALISNNENDEAYTFIKNTMTLKGIMDGPNGQPAMYEVRNGNKNNPAEYGQVDKPQFMWSAGWYLYSLYNLFMMDESGWNISFDPYLPANLEKVNFGLSINNHYADVQVSGKGENVAFISYDGNEYPSLVIPGEIKKADKINIELGAPTIPMLTSTNSRLISAKYDANTMEVNLEAFPGHKNITTIVSPFDVENVLPQTDMVSFDVQELNNLYIITVNFEHTTSGSEELVINFKR